jgi:drug/metabolite transporter (DMT)-like permease
MTLNPILVLILTAIVLKERMTAFKIAGIIIGATGAILIILNNMHAGGKSGNITGDILIFINAASFAIFLIMIKPIINRYSAVTVSYWLFLFGSVLITPICLNEFTNTNFELFTGSTWLAVLYIVVGTAVVGYLLYIFALKNLSPVITSSYIYSQPLIASLVAVVIGQDSLNSGKIIAAIFIFVGVYLTSAKIGKNYSK